MHWTRNLTGVKNLYGGVFDISNGLIEWNVGPNLTRQLNNGSMQVCDDKICNITTTRTVNTLEKFGDETVRRQRTVQLQLTRRGGG